MTSLRILLLIVSTLYGLPAGAGDIEDLADLLVGTFDSELVDPDRPDDRPSNLPDDQPNNWRLVDRRIRLDLPNLGAHVFYQQINHREGLTVYRQRLLVLTDAPGHLELRAYALREPEWYVDANASSFERMTTEDLAEILPHGCEQVWTRTDDGFSGYVDPDQCQVISSRTGKARRIEAESHISRDRLLLAERGYDADSRKQLFGSAPDEFRILGRRQ